MAQGQVEGGFGELAGGQLPDSKALLKYLLYSWAEAGS